MAHHKRRRPKSTRAGCLLCKPWKRQECAKHKRMKFSDVRRADQAKRMVCEGGRVNWQSIETAPRDGTTIQAKIPGHGSDNMIAWTSDLLDSDQNYCGGWMFVEDQEPPDDWTDGICWAVNEDGIRSTWPTHWRPSPPSKAR